MRNAASVALRVDAYKAEIYSIGQASAKSSSQDASLKAELATLEAKLEASVAQLELTAASAAALRRECEALHTEQEASTQRTGALQSELMGALQSESESMHRIDALQLESAAYASEAKEWRDASSFAAADASAVAPLRVAVARLEAELESSRASARTAADVQLAALRRETERCDALDAERSAESRVLNAKLIQMRAELDAEKEGAAAMVEHMHALLDDEVIRRVEADAQSAVAAEALALVTGEKRALLIAHSQRSAAEEEASAEEKKETKASGARMGAHDREAAAAQVAHLAEELEEAHARIRALRAEGVAEHEREAHHERVQEEEEARLRAKLQRAVQELAAQRKAAALLAAAQQQREAERDAQRSEDAAHTTARLAAAAQSLATAKARIASTEAAAEAQKRAAKAALTELRVEMAQLTALRTEAEAQLKAAYAAQQRDAVEKSTDGTATKRSAAAAETALAEAQTQAQLLETALSDALQREAAASERSEQLGAQLSLALAGAEEARRAASRKSDQSGNAQSAEIAQLRSEMAASKASSNTAMKLYVQKTKALMAKVSGKYAKKSARVKGLQAETARLASSLSAARSELALSKSAAKTTFSSENVAALRAELDATTQALEESSANADARCTAIAAKAKRQQIQIKEHIAEAAQRQLNRTRDRHRVRTATILHAFAHEREMRDVAVVEQQSVVQALRRSSVHAMKVANRGAATGKRLAALVRALEVEQRGALAWSSSSIGSDAPALKIALDREARKLRKKHGETLQLKASHAMAKTLVQRKEKALTEQRDEFTRLQSRLHAAEAEQASMKQKLGRALSKRKLKAKEQAATIIRQRAAHAATVHSLRELLRHASEYVDGTIEADDFAQTLDTCAEEVAAEENELDAARERATLNAFSSFTSTRE